MLHIIMKKVYCVCVCVCVCDVTEGKDGSEGQ